LLLGQADIRQNVGVNLGKVLASRVRLFPDFKRCLSWPSCEMD
jgi:hypothetical protein